MEAGIFAAVDGLRPGNRTYTTLRWVPVSDLVPSPVDSDNAPSSGENDEWGRQPEEKNKKEKHEFSELLLFPLGG